MKEIKSIAKIILFALFIILNSVSILFSQSTKKIALQNEYKNLLSDIKILQNVIDKRKKEQNISIKEVVLINTKIEKRKKLIDNIQVQKEAIDGELKLKQGEYSSIKIEIEKLKLEYIKLLLWLNKNHNTVNKLAFVLEADNFKEAYHRIKYIKKYSDFRVKQSGYLKVQIGRILERINLLNSLKAEKLNILQVNQHQQKELIIEKGNRDSLVKSLSKELSDLKLRVKKKNQQAEAVNARIKKIIEDEIRKQREALLAKARERKLKERKSNPNSNVDIDRIDPIDLQKSPEGILSSSFLASKGSLPWPVSSGSVTSKFGRQPHPADPDLFVDNNGIDIKTSNNSDAKAIYKGTVVQIFEMPSYQTCLLIKHGDFFSVYSYLKSSTVNVGDKVSAGQTIGICGYDESHGYSLINLQIWHYQNKQNPVSWLSSR